MIQSALFIFIFILAACTIQPNRTGLSPAKLIWQDEFDGKKLDQSRWNYRSLGKRRDAVNSKETVSLDGKGHLILTTDRFGKTIRTSMLGTQDKFEHKFGYWEARMRFQKQPGHWSAFWLQSPTIRKTGNVKKYGAEIDIIEYLAIKGDTVLNNIHWDGYGQQHKHAGGRTAFPGLSNGFHKIGLWWKKNLYIFYVDDQEVYRTSQGVSHCPEYIILSLEVGKWGGNISKAALPDSLVVDYLRVYDTRP